MGSIAAVDCRRDDAEVPRVLSTGKSDPGGSVHLDDLCNQLRHSTSSYSFVFLLVSLWAK